MKAPVLFAAFVFSATLCAQALKEGNFGASKKDTTAEREKAPAIKPKVKSYPFHGDLESVATDGRSLALRGKAKQRIILISADTRVFRDGLKASLKEGNSGERVTGTVFRNSEGKEEALTVRFGGKSTKSPEQSAETAARR
jgi:hypothetical protein